MKKIYLLILMLISSVGINAQSSLISIKINETIESTGFSLQNAIGPNDLSNIIKLEINGGDITANDWSYLKLNNVSFNQMISFVVTDDVTSVADIPDSLTGSSLLNKNVIQEVVISKVESIGAFAFANCKSLTSVAFPAAKFIRSSAFSFCELLTDVSLPEAMSIGETAFVECVSLTSAVFPNVRRIGMGAFNECTSLANVSFFQAVIISEAAFYECTSLTSVILPAITNIGNAVFGDCVSLNELQLPESVPVVGEDVFYNLSDDRNLKFVGVSGELLTGEAYDLAKANYIAHEGYTSDKWYGWVISDEPCLVPDLPIATDVLYSYGDVSMVLSATALVGHTLNWYTVEVGGTVFSEAPMPSTETVGTRSYWVSQTNACGNESGRVKIEVEVTQKQITITPNADQSKVEGQVDPVFAYTVSPALIGTDDLTGALIREAGEAVGEYPYLLGDLSAGDNYELVLSDSNTFEITPDLSTEDVLLVNSVNIYPNPAQDIVNVQMNKTSLKTIKVYNIQGKKVLETQESIFNVQNLMDEMYLVKIEDEEGKIIYKKLLKN